MSLQNLKDRVEKLERCTGMTGEPEVIIVNFISPGDSEPTPEETAAIDDYVKKVKAEPIAEGEIVKAIFWTKEKAQELLALAG